MTDNEKEEIIKCLLKEKKIKQIYDTYIIKEISFENWVRRAAYDLLTPVQVDANIILDKIMGGDNDKIRP